MRTDGAKMTDVAIHPIQLVDVALVQVVFTNLTRPNPKVEIDPMAVAIGYIPGAVDFSSRIFAHTVRAMYNMRETENGLSADSQGKAPYALFIELYGTFTFTENINQDTIEEFQKTSAMSILLPYLREHVYSMTMRAGVSPVLLPLTMVNLIRISEGGKLIKKS